MKVKANMSSNNDTGHEDRNQYNRTIADSEVIDRLLRQSGTSLEQEKEKIRAEERARRAEEAQLRLEAKEREKREIIRREEAAVLAAYPRYIVATINGKVLERPASLSSIACPNCDRPISSIRECFFHAKRMTTLSKSNGLGRTTIDGMIEFAPASEVLTKTCPCLGCGHELRIMIESRCLYDGEPRGLMAAYRDVEDLGESGPAPYVNGEEEGA